MADKDDTLVRTSVASALPPAAIAIDDLLAARELLTYEFIPPNVYRSREFRIAKCAKPFYINVDLYRVIAEQNVAKFCDS